MRTCVIIAPNDRYNYGDLLFSHVLREMIGEYYDKIFDVATVDSDLSQYGGHKVHSIKCIQNLVGHSNFDLILAGGHSLFCPWPFVLFCLDDKYKWLNKLNVLLSKLLGPQRANRFINQLSMVVFGGNTKYPYSVGKFEIKGINNIIYNAVDGYLGESIDHKDKRILSSIDYLSVRNNNTHDKLGKWGIGSHISPDSAIQLSKIFPLQEVRNQISIDPEYLKSSYIVFQVNRSLGEQYISDICKNIRTIINDHNLKVYLCPIGFAKGHEDLVALKKIYRNINSGNIHLFENLNIWDIMSLIANSKGFVGSSLHGCITAMSYCRPYIGLEVPKTLDYIRDWGLGDDFCANCKSFEQQLENAINCPQELLDRNFAHQLNKSNDNFLNIQKVIAS